MSKSTPFLISGIEAPPEPPMPKPKRYSLVFLAAALALFSAIFYDMRGLLPYLTKTDRLALLKFRMGIEVNRIDGAYKYMEVNASTGGARMCLDVFAKPDPEVHDAAATRSSPSTAGTPGTDTRFAPAGLPPAQTGSQVGLGPKDPQDETPHAPVTSKAQASAVNQCWHRLLANSGHYSIGLILIEDIIEYYKHKTMPPDKVTIRKMRQQLRSIRENMEYPLELQDIYDHTRKVFETSVVAGWLGLRMPAIGEILHMKKKYDDMDSALRLIQSMESAAQMSAEYASKEPANRPASSSDKTTNIEQPPQKARDSRGPTRKN